MGSTSSCSSQQHTGKAAATLSSMAGGVNVAPISKRTTAHQAPRRRAALKKKQTTTVKARVSSLDEVVHPHEHALARRSASVSKAQAADKAAMREQVLAKRDWAKLKTRGEHEREG